MDGILFNCGMFSPAVIGGGYLFYRFLRRFVPCKRKQKKDQERQQVWFYNCWFPLVITILIWGLLWPSFFFPQMEHEIVILLLLMATGSMYVVFYLLYHFFYWLARLCGCKIRFDARIFWGNVEVWGMIWLYCSFFIGSHQ